MSVQVFLLIWLGFALLCVAMPRHTLDVLPGRKLTRLQQRLLRGAGASLLVLSGWQAVAVSGVGYGMASWTGLLTLVLVLQAVLLSVRPRWLASVSLVVVAAGVLA